jgi:N-acetyl-gamma-glutamyl-phosphate reductase common form
MKKINVCVIGARSFSAGHLIKLLLQHKHVTIHMLVSESDKEGEDIENIHPFLRGLLQKTTENYDKERVVEENDVLFFHKNHGEFRDRTADLIDYAEKRNKPVKFIDLSADFRLKEQDLYKKWYKFEHHRPDLLKQSVYGLTELYREDIKKATLVANPGCYPTATLLALAPLLEGGFIDGNKPIFIDSLSGVSGAGNQPSGSNLAIHVEQNVIPYKIGHTHQHIPEMEQEIAKMLKKKVEVTFSPHLLSFKYGILSTHYVQLKEACEWGDVYSIYENMYGNEPFIRIIDSSDRKTFPEVRNVEGTNFCDIGFVAEKGSKICVVISAIDNIIKGASGQAIQNMNVMCGFEETEGLPYSKALRVKSPHRSISLGRSRNN